MEERNSGRIPSRHSTFGGATSVTANVTLLVGQTYWFTAGLFNAAQAGASYDFQQGNSNTVSLSATAYTLIDLPTGDTYTTGSGTQYLRELPRPVSAPDSGSMALLLGIGLATVVLVSAKRRSGSFAATC